MSFAEKKMLTDKILENMACELTGTQLMALKNCIDSQFDQFDIKQQKVELSGIDDYLEAFISAKKIEGRSNKTIERYKKGYGALGIRKYLYANIETTSSSDPYYYWTELNHYYKNDITNYDAHINIEGLKVRYKMDLDFLLAHSLFVEESILKSYDTIIFENGQGLLLGEQQSEETWWSGTPSNTGCLIASNIINDNMLRGIIEVCYVTRTYLTRHGIGELPNECKFKEDINISIGYDATNYRNTTQGCLRYAPLDIESLQERIDQDFLLAPFGSRKSIMFTHWNENKIKLSDKDDFIDNIDRLYISKTKNAEDIHL